MRKTVVAALLLAVGHFAASGQEKQKNETAEVDVASLCAFFESNPLKAQKEIGSRWVRLKDRVSNIVAPVKKGAPVKLILINRFDSLPSVIECSFDPKHADALKSVEKGGVVRLRGKLDRFTLSAIYLKHCELVVTKKK